MARLGYPPRAGRQRGGEPATLAHAILDRAGGAPRFMVAIAGPPGAGKSTLAEAVLARMLEAGETAAIVPMDGFHFDDIVLEARGLKPRKGAPETFDVAGLLVMLRRLGAREADVAIPVFDRSIEVARAGAAIVPAGTRILLVEGNYLLLDEPPWTELAGLFDLTVMLDVPLEELESRLVRRWLGHGFDETGAMDKALSNDIPNARRVVAASRPADIVLRS
ncbi:MAG: nucleoside triphosphate hydrolase [Rhizobiaceae bacterium]|nr:nucleoside triphosphate hydrolase [Rhizobiaceae bacterium]MCV0405136.1 nucleoside triphosphate hydrolase [Rhizobiaceae bacterium]